MLLLRYSCKRSSVRHRNLLGKRSRFLVRKPKTGFSMSTQSKTSFQFPYFSRLHGLLDVTEMAVFNAVLPMVEVASKVEFNDRMCCCLFIPIVCEC